MLQDFFDSRLLAMDTDFRIFSAQHHGSLPGIDLAYILDGAAYHTKQDTVARIRKGTVQARSRSPDTCRKYSTEECTVYLELMLLGR